jgi:hypothetical protein
MKEDQRKGKIQTEKQRRRNSPVTVLTNSIKNTSACQQTNTAVRDVQHPRTRLRVSKQTQQSGTCYIQEHVCVSANKHISQGRATSKNTSVCQQTNTAVRDVRHPRTRLCVSKQTQQSGTCDIQEHTVCIPAYSWATRQPTIWSSHLRVTSFVAIFNYVHRRPASASSAVENKRVIKKRISSQDVTGIVRNLTRQIMTVPQAVTERNTQQRSASYRRQFICFCITHKALTKKEAVVFISNLTASPHGFTSVHELPDATCKYSFQSRAKPRINRVLDLLIVCN